MFSSQCLTVHDLVFMVSSSLQISGSYLLVHMVFSRGKKQISGLGKTVIPTKEVSTDRVNYPLIDILLLETLLSRFGFTYIFSGYILAILGERNPDFNHNYLVLIICFSIVLSLFGIIMAKCKTNIIKSEYQSYANENPEENEIIIDNQIGSK